MGQPDPERICTSIVNRSNLSLKMGVRRFTRLTKCLPQEVGKSRGCCDAVVRVLQFLPGLQIASPHARHASRIQRSHLEGAGTTGGCVISRCWPIWPRAPFTPPRPATPIAHSQVSRPPRRLMDSPMPYAPRSILANSLAGRGKLGSTIN
jgi:hypothetical protein